MEAYARAGIDVYDTELRYAEVEQYGTRYRLLRLGSCEFDFNLTNDLITTGIKKSIGIVSEAIGDVFSGSTATEFQIALHPPSCYSFFVPIAASLSETERKVHLQQETALLAGVDAALRITADAVYTETMDGGEAVEWVHVVAVDEAIHDRFERILAAFPHADFRFVVSMHSAANTMANIDNGQQIMKREASPYEMAIGWYPTHIEYTLCRKQRWYSSQFSVAGSFSDSAYFAVTLLKHLGIRPHEVGQVYVYGIGAGHNKSEIYQSLFSSEPEFLNPLSVVDLYPGSLTSTFDAESYVPCIGAALGL